MGLPRGALFWVGLAVIGAGLPLAAAECKLSLTFQPPGVTNVPYAWTAAGQEALKNKKPWELASVKLAAVPTPTLFVSPSHPLLGAVASCVADCLEGPGGKAGSRRLTEAGGSGGGQSSGGGGGAWGLPAALGGLLTGRRLREKGDADKPPAKKSSGGGEKKAPAPKPEKLALEAGEKKKDAPAAAPAAQCAAPTDPGNLLEPGVWSLTWALDGGKAAEVGPFQGTLPVAIKLEKLAVLAKGKHYIDVAITLKPKSASVSGAGALPSKELVVRRRVDFELVDVSDAPDPSGPAAGTAAGTVIPGAPAGADPVADALAMKYYCALNFNVGGSIKKNITVNRVAEDGPLSPGAFMCARQCNKMGPSCAAFGVVAGESCYLMGGINATAGGADSLVTAVCMKSVQDWLAFGAARGIAASRDKYYCLPTFDVQGWPAGQGPPPGPDDIAPPAPAQPVVTDFPTNTEPTICAGQCSTTPGCEFFVQTKPAGCYLKGRPFDSDSPFGTTGPNKDVDVSCFRGEDGWTRAGGLLDAALPQQPVLYNGGGVLTGAVAGAVPGTAAPGVGAGNATAAMYYCAREYALNGSVLSKSNVGSGDVGTVACAAACDAAGAACAAHMTDALGTCTLLKDYKLDSAAPDPLKYSLCFKSVKEWEAFGRPDKGGMYCLKKYDIAGDGITTRDFVTITSGAGAVEFCKGQCAGVPECEFVVTQLTKCYLKSNIQGGSYGKTGASQTTDATCVKGADNWLKFALQVSNQPATAAAAEGVPGQGMAVAPGTVGMMLPTRRKADGSALNGAGARAAAPAAAAAAWLLAAALALAA